MIKDYARPIPTKKPRRQRKWLAAFIITLAIAIPTLMYLHNKNHRAPAVAATQGPQKSVSTKKNNASDFDFYTLLPEMDVPNQ